MIAAASRDGWMLVALQPDRAGWWAQLSATDGRGSVVKTSADAESALRAALEGCLAKRAVGAEDLL